MALLKIVSGNSTGAAFQIGGGVLKVGRGEENDLRMPDASVSKLHCEISLDTVGNLVVRDLGSSNGTFINGAQVREASFLQPGQTLRLGTLELVFEGDSMAAPPPAAIPAPLNMPPPPVSAVRAVPTAVAAPTAVPVIASPDDCVNHPGVKAKSVCMRCGRRACGQCTKQQKLGMNIVDFCLACGGQCKKASTVAKEAALAAARPKSFAAAVAQSFKYPFTGNGLILLLCGTIFYAFMDFLLGGFKGGIVVFFSIAVFVIAYGYLFAYMQHIVRCSAVGETDPPSWPEVSDIQADIVQPFFQLLITLLVSFAPAWAVTTFMGPVPGQFAMILSLIYFPMALLGVAMSDSYACLNPVFVLSSIMKAPKQYLIACLAFGLIVSLRYYVQEGLYAIEIPVLPQLLFWFIFLMALMIQMRILGIFYYLNREKLGWGV